MDRLYVVYNGGVAPCLETLAERLASPETRVRGITLTREEHDRLEGGNLSHESLKCAESIHASIPESPPDTDALSTFERQYGDPSLQQFAVGDPAYIDADHDRRRTALAHWFRFYETEFDEFRPDVLLTSRVDGAYVWIPHRMTVVDGRTAIRWKETRVGTRYAAVCNSPYDDLTGVRTLFESFQRGDEDPASFPEARAAACEYFEQYETDDPVRPGYFDRRQSSFGRSVPRTLFPRSAVDADARRTVLGAVRGEGGYHSPDLRDCLDTYVSRAINRSRIAIENPFEAPDVTEPFVFFPLHAQPESSTYVLSQAFMDQLALVKQLSRSLPVNYRLYVKDHPRMLRDNPRSVRTYRAMADLPNVRLVEPNHDSHALVRASDCVVTVTGTPGFEAALHGTPSILFGPAHFTLLDGVERCECPTRLPELFDRLLSEYTQPRTQIEQYLTALFVRSVDAGTDVRAVGPVRQRQFATDLLPEIRRLLPDERE